MKKAVLCTTETLCHAILRYAQDDRCKGIVIADYVNLKTWKPTRRLILYKETANAKPVLMNFCPWCGGDLAARRTAKPYA